MAENSASRRFVLSAYSFLIDKRGFPSPALGIGQYGDEHHQPTVVVIDPTTERVLCVIEQLSDDDDLFRAERAKSCVDFLRRKQLRVPAYLLTPGTGDPNELRVFMLDSHGDWQSIGLDGFPTYNELVSLQSPLKQVKYQQEQAATRSSSVAALIILFLTLIFCLSFFWQMDLQIEELWILGGIGFFAILPELAKIRILNFEAERALGAERAEKFNK